MSTLTIIATVWTAAAIGITGWLAAAAEAGKRVDRAWEQHALNRDAQHHGP